MELHLAKNVQSTLMERIFRKGDIAEGVIQSNQISTLLQNLHPELTIDANELETIVLEHDKDGSGTLDFDSIIKIILHFLLKQSVGSHPSQSEEQYPFSNDKTPLTLEDFVLFTDL